MFRRKRSAEDFAEEIKAHLELETDELKGEGLSIGCWKDTCTHDPNTVIYPTVAALWGLI